VKELAEKLFKRMLKKLKVYNASASIYNRYQHMARVRTYRKMKETGEAPLPKRILFEPTQCCNLRCKMCFFNRDMTIKPNEMTTEQIKKAIGNMGSANFVNLVGGEVMVRPDIFDIMDYLKSKGMEIQVGTNGTLINEANAGRLTSNDNITAATISIDGERDLHNSIRRTDFAFDNAIRGISLIKDRIPVYVVTVIMDDNVEQLPNIVKLMGTIGVKNLTFEYERKYTEKEVEESAKIVGLAKENFPVSISETKDRKYDMETLRRKLEEAVEVGKRFGVNVGFFPSFLYSNLENCYNETLRKNGKYMCRNLFIGRVDPQGNVIYCYAIRKTFGNLLKKPIVEIWNSDEMKEFRKRLLNNNLLPICETCLYMERVGE
jgi:MoaA/NifB/PqqE/SkfB family radical SAM enzyme